MSSPIALKRLRLGAASPSVSGRQSGQSGQSAMKGTGLSQPPIEVFTASERLLFGQQCNTGAFSRTTHQGDQVASRTDSHR